MNLHFRVLLTQMKILLFITIYLSNTIIIIKFYTNETVKESIDSVYCIALKSWSTAQKFSYSIFFPKWGMYPGPDMP